MTSDSGDAVALLGLTLAFRQGGHRYAALGTARRAVATGPALLDARLVLAALERQIGDVNGALRTLLDARTLAPRYPVLLRLLADVYRRARRPADALDTARLALTCEASLDNIVCVGDALVACESLDAAENVYRRALSIDGRLVRAMFGLGRIALLRSDWQGAWALFTAARDIAPNDPDIRYNLALLDLRFERYAAGFAAYPAIMDTESDGARYHYHHEGIPLWNGEPPAGRRLLIGTDQGLGDHLMMARFFDRLPANDGEVTVETPPELLALFARSFPSVRFEPFAHWRSPATMDLHLPIMQLPRIAAVARPSDLAGEAYLRADARRVAARRAMLGRSVRHVGIAWHGNRLNSRERWRAAPLDAWAPLAAVRDVQFHALHLDVERAELDAAPLPIHPMPLHVRSMDDTAALMGALDAVVSVDTSIVHLAGALGRPVWLANPLVSDFRWGINRATTPWYASLRIVGQTASDVWRPVFERIAADLARRLRD